MLVIRKECLTGEVEKGDLVQDRQTGDYGIIGFKAWGDTQGFFVFEFVNRDISGIYDNLEEMLEERDLQLIAKEEDLAITLF